jgi:hypothetical protein
MTLYPTLSNSLHPPLKAVCSVRSSDVPSRGTDMLAMMHANVTPGKVLVEAW